MDWVNIISWVHILPAGSHGLRRHSSVCVSNVSVCAVMACSVSSTSEHDLVLVLPPIPHVPVQLDHTLHTEHTLKAVCGRITKLSWASFLTLSILIAKLSPDIPACYLVIFCYMLFVCFNNCVNHNDITRKCYVFFVIFVPYLSLFDALKAFCFKCIIVVCAWLIFQKWLINKVHFAQK